jgi:hypothetical protein
MGIEAGREAAEDRGGIPTGERLVAELADRGVDAVEGVWLVVEDENLREAVARSGYPVAPAAFSRWMRSSASVTMRKGRW